MQWREALIQKQGIEVVEKLGQAVVGVCGLGGLGSGIALMLARAGVGKLVLIDFDRVEMSNLNRQQYRRSQIGMRKTEALSALLREIVPESELTLELHTLRLSAETCAPILKECSVVCEAFDRAEEKAMLVNTVLRELPNCTVIAASGIAGLDSGNRIRTRRVSKRLYLCGDERSDVETASCLMGTRVMLCAAQQAHLAVQQLTGCREENREREQEE